MNNCGPQNAALVFMHIPKTGGITLRRMLKMHIACWPPSNLLNHDLILGKYKIQNFAERLEHIQTMRENQKRRIKYFEGHFGFGIDSYFLTPSNYFTLLRDPVERTISTYFHLQKPEVMERYDIPRLDFKSLMKMGKAWGGTHGHYFDNCHVRYLAGEGGRPVEVEFGKCDSSMLDLAKRRLREKFITFGLTEYFDESVVFLMGELGWNFGFYVTSNVNKARKPASELDQDDLEFVRQHNALDLDLYDWALSIFQERIAEAGDRFSKKVARFRRFNGIVNSLVGLVV